MESLTKQIATILSRAESELRGLIAEAAKDGDYRGVDISRSAASRIAQLIEHISSGNNNGLPAESATPGRSGSPSDRIRAKGRKGDYPRFFVRRGVLHKVGWSKRDKKEYAHKIPKDAFDRTIGAIAALAASESTPITSDQIVEQTEHSGTPVPVYQVYLALALLRDRELVKREGRDGYLAISGLKAAAGKLWDEFQTT
jgi:hypothetical protein